jgi:hypothetical protein
MCVVPKSGPINVTGDLTYFFKLRTLSDPGRQVVVTVKKCNVIIDNVIGSDVTFSDQEFSFGPYNRVPPANKAAEWYIIHPQLSENEQQAFRSPFTGAVNVHCDLEYRADPAASVEQTPRQKPPECILMGMEDEPQCR